MVVDQRPANTPMPPPTATGPGGKLEWVDALKGLGIIAVVFGHMQPLTHTAATWLIYQFHMPLFFILAGMFQRPIGPEQSFLAFVGLRARKRLVPYLGYCALTAVLWYGLFSHLGRGTGFHYSPAAMLRSIMAGNPLSNVVLWFYPCLFFAEIFAYPFRAVGPRLGALAALGLAVLLSTPWLDLNGHPGLLSAGVAVVATPFLLLGFFLKDLLKWLARQPVSIGLVTLGLGFGLTVGFGHLSGGADMRSATFGKVGWFYLAALSGFAMSLSAARLLGGLRLLRAVGAASGLIFPVHMLLRTAVSGGLALALHTTEQQRDASIPLGLLNLVIIVALLTGCHWLWLRHRQEWLGSIQSRAKKLLGRGAN